MASEQVAMTEKPRITLHWLDKSRAQQIVWLLEECKDIDYNIKVYTRAANKTAPPELKNVHPLGKSPLITIDNVPGATKPFVLAETAFIAEYLSLHFANHLVPTQWTPGMEGRIGGETEEWLRYRYFMHYCEGSFMSLSVSRVLVGAMTSNDQIPWLVKPVTRKLAEGIDSVYFNPNFKNHFGFLEQQIASSPGGGEYLCGKTITAADIVMSFGLLAASKRNEGLTKVAYPNLMAYIERLEQNQVYQRAVKKTEEATGEPYSVV